MEEIRNEILETHHNCLDGSLKQDNAIEASWYFEVKSENNDKKVNSVTLNIDEHRVLCNETKTNEVFIKNEPQEYERSLIDNKFGIRSLMRSNESVAVIKLPKMIFYDRNFVCDICNVISPSLAKQKLHKSTHKGFAHNDILYECDLCFHLCLSSALLKEHRSIHSGNKSDKYISTNILSGGSRSHKKINVKERPFKCEECNFAGKHFYQLKKHNMIHSGEKPFKCEFCDYGAVTQSKLKIHKVIHFEDRPFKCDQCNYTGKRSCDIKIHNLSHLKEKQYKCDECDYTCVYRNSLRTHKWTHSGEKPFKCCKCSYASKYSCNLKVHKLTHSIEKPFKCDACSYVSKRSSDLKMHKLTHHTKKLQESHQSSVENTHLSDHQFECLNNEKSSKVTSLIIENELSVCPLMNSNKSVVIKLRKMNFYERNFVCIVCYSVFPSSTEEKLHLEYVHKDITQNDTVFRCDICFRVCLSSSLLDEHKMTHSVNNFAKNHTASNSNRSVKMIEKPFKCAICNFTSNRSFSLKKHSMIHTGEKPFKCEHCNYACLSEYRLKLHNMIHSGEKPFKCGECNYTCIQRRHLTEHKMTHSGEKPFKCGECSFASTRLNCLKLHKKTHPDVNRNRFDEHNESSIPTTDLDHIITNKTTRHVLKQFKCEECHYSYVTEYSLNVHKLTHSGDKPFKCDQCDYASIRLCHLTVHKLSHSGEKAFKCDECSFASTRLYCLKQHQKTHSAVKKYKCDECDYTSFRHSLLKRHKVIHSEKRPFKCTECCYSSKRSEDLRKHRMTHNLEDMRIPEDSRSTIVLDKKHLNKASLSKSQKACLGQNVDVNDTKIEFKDIQNQNNEEQKSANNCFVFKHEVPDQPATSSYSDKPLNHKNTFGVDDKMTSPEVSNVGNAQKSCFQEKGGGSYIKDEPPEYEEYEMSITESVLSDDKSGIRPIAIPPKSTAL